MAVETKPLFHPEVIRQQLGAFTLPATVEAAQAKLQHWADLIASGKADAINEKALLPDFLTDVFLNLLGYTAPAGPSDTFTLSRETHVEVDGKFADAALGRFGRRAPGVRRRRRGKGPARPARPAVRGPQDVRGRSGAIATPSISRATGSSSPRCGETRLYHKGSNQHTYERFETVRLASDRPCSGASSSCSAPTASCPEAGECHLYALLDASEASARELTNEFYVRLRRAAAKGL